MRIQDLELIKERQALLLGGARALLSASLTQLREPLRGFVITWLREYDAESARIEQLLAESKIEEGGL